MYDMGGRRKAFFGGYLAKYMFLKRCRIEKLDPFKDFFKLAGTVYQVPADGLRTVDSDSDNE